MFHFTGEIASSAREQGKREPTYFWCFLNDTNGELAALLLTQLLQPDGRSEASRAPAHDHHVVLHHLALVLTIGFLAEPPRLLNLEPGLSNSKRT
jgi:hypothetical protein